jgi:glycosyltransferase involved in cell wall biosynthesis
LKEAGAEVLYVGLSPAPAALSPYFCIGPPVEKPTWKDFYLRREALRSFLEEQRVEVAHPIHLTPSGVWVWLSGFRPYVPFAMGADVLEYAPNPPALPWDLQTQEPTLRLRLRTTLRRIMLSPLLRLTLSDSLFSMGDNYQLCFTKKFFEKEKKYIEVPAGIALDGENDGEGEKPRRLLLAPRGATPFYQAETILEGYSSYLKEGGNLPLFLLAGPYPIHPRIAYKASILEKRNPEMFYFYRKLLSKKEMVSLWKQTLAFVSAPLYDGYSYAVAEGRYYGALPIVNAIPGNLETITHGYNGWIVEPFTASKLAETFHAVESLSPSIAPLWQGRNAAWVRRFSNLAANAQLFLQKLRESLST